MCRILVKTWTEEPIDIGDSVELVEDYLNDPRRRLYDLAPVEQNNELGLLDPWAANLLGARLTNLNATDLLAAGGNISESLGLLRNGLSLFQEIGEDRWTAMSNLFQAFLDIPGVKCAKTTKILHKKRPRLIPPVDSRVVARYGEGLDPDGGHGLVGIVKRIRSDILHNLDCLHQTRSEIPDLDGITIVRVFDMILWQANEQ